MIKPSFNKFCTHQRYSPTRFNICCGHWVTSLFRFI